MSPETAVAVAESDVIELNVCGELMAAKRRTLCQVEGSLLAAMFSGRWEGSLARDAHGRVFLEFNPICFRALLNALIRDSLAPGSACWRNPTVAAEHAQDMRSTMLYLGLHHRVPIELRPGRASGYGITADEDGRTLRRTDFYGTHAPLRSSNPSVYSSLSLPPKCSWEMSIRLFGKWMFLGVCSNRFSPKVVDAFQDSTNSFGWKHTSGECEYSPTSPRTTTECEAPPVGLAQPIADLQHGDRVLMCIDAVGCSLKMVVERDGCAPQTYRRALPRDAAARPWFIHFALGVPGDAVELISCVSEHEVGSRTALAGTAP